MPDRAGPGLQVARENRRHSGAYVEDFRGRPAGREQARRHQIPSVRALVRGELAHAIVALVGGVMFGASVIRAKVYPVWTGVAVIAGLILSLLLIELHLPEAIQTSGTALRSAGFIGMGVACLRGRPARSVAA